MAGFVQIIEFKTSRIDEIRAYADSYRERHPEMGPQRITITADRDRPDTYCSIVEFESYEAAMRNSEHPVTQEFAAAMDAMCDEPATFRNLDVIRQDIRIDAQQRVPGAAELTDA